MVVKCLRSIKKQPKNKTNKKDLYRDTAKGGFIVLLNTLIPCLSIKQAFILGA